MAIFNSYVSLPDGTCYVSAEVSMTVLKMSAMEFLTARAVADVPALTISALSGGKLRGSERWG